MSSVREDYKLTPMKGVGKVQQKFIDALDELGPSTHKEIAECIGIDWADPSKRTSMYVVSKRLEKKGRILRIRASTPNSMYNFFEDIFTERSYLILKPEQLEDLTEDIIDCLPERMSPSIRDSLDTQMLVLRSNGLPKLAYEKIVDSYGQTPVISEADMYRIYTYRTGHTPKAGQKKKKAKKTNKGSFYYHTVDIFGMELGFVPMSSTSSPLEIWMRMDGLIRYVSFDKIASDDGIPRLYNALIKIGYKLPNEEEFTEAFSQELENYLDDILS